MRRGPITKQGSKLIRWAAIEAAQRLGHDTWLHAERERLAERRNSRAVAKTAIARKLITLAYYGLRGPARSAASTNQHREPHDREPCPDYGAHAWFVMAPTRGVAVPLIASTDRLPNHTMPLTPGRRDDRHPITGLTPCNAHLATAHPNPEPTPERTAPGRPTPPRALQADSPPARRTLQTPLLQR